MAAVGGSTHALTSLAAGSARTWERLHLACCEDCHGGHGAVLRLDHLRRLDVDRTEVIWCAFIRTVLDLWDEVAAIV